MTWLLSGAAALVFFAAQPDAAPAVGLFSVAEMRAMCRGESDGDPRFRTQAAYELLAELQRAKCRMYLLGIAEGIGEACAADPRGRDALGARLAAAVLRAPEDRETSVAALVRAELLLRPGCR
ncbi:MAG TPA: hypothetical protein VEC11_15640 [Allosphingosinicella sp.]|nr:hypothetical protein [Allosphingosinicella sp.]